MRITASKLPLVEHCQWWARPDVEWDQRPSESSLLGSAVHYFIEQAILGNRVTMDQLAHKFFLHEALVPNLRYMCEAWARKFPLFPNTWTPEVSLACDVTTLKAREIGRNRDYSKKTETEIPGTSDIVSYEDGIVHIIDWKTGRQIGLARPSQNAQLLFLAMCAAKIHGVSRARLTLCHIMPDKVDAVEDEVDEMVLAAAAYQLRHLRPDESSPNKGWWCRYKFCPAKSNCPEWKPAVA